jgi:hypothetical protein
MRRAMIMAQVPFIFRGGWESGVSVLCGQRGYHGVLCLRDLRSPSGSNGVSTPFRQHSRLRLHVQLNEALAETCGAASEIDDGATSSILDGATSEIFAGMCLGRESVGVGVKVPPPSSEMYHV